MVRAPAEAPAWAHDLCRAIDAELSALRNVPKFSKTDLPKALDPVRVILVSDDIGGAVLAFNSGGQWLRVTDRLVIS